MEKMTMREFLNAVIAETSKEEIKAFALAEIDKMDKKNAKRKATLSPTQKENEKLLTEILTFLVGKDFTSAREVADHFEISVNKSASLLKKLDDDELTEVKEVKSSTGKGKVKAHKLTAKAEKVVAEMTK